MTQLKEITCIIVDDDLVDRLTTVSYLKDYPGFSILGNYESPAEALRAAKSLKPDVVFLDIDMPEFDGLKLRSLLMEVPACVFITSFPEYAVEGFEMEALDYLVKPYTADRFEKMMNRLSEYFLVRSRSEMLSHTLGADTIFIKEGTRQVKLQLHEVIFLEAMKDYTSINTPSKRYMVLEPLSRLMQDGAFSSFIRIHRSFAVQKHYIKQYNNSKVTLTDNSSFPVGRSFKDSLQNFKA